MKPANAAMALGTPALPDRDPLHPPPPQGMKQGAAMAAGAHLMLVAALAFSVNWRISEPVGLEAEIWSATPQAAAPAGEPPPERLPEPTPPPPPVPKVQEAARAEEAEIALQKMREKKRQEEEAQLKLEQAKLERAREAKEQAEREKAQKEKALKDRLDKEKADKLKAEKANAEKEKAEKAAEQKREAQAQAKRLEDQRQAQLKRMMGQVGAGGTGAPDSKGTAAQSGGPSPSYAGRVVARIKPNIVLTDPVPGNPRAEVEIRIAPDGRILSKRLLQSSGQKAWDEAVLRAIDRTEILPRDTDGRVPPVMVIGFRPAD